MQHITSSYKRGGKKGGETTRAGSPLTLHIVRGTIKNHDNIFNNINRLLINVRKLGCIVYTYAIHGGNKSITYTLNCNNL